MSEIKLFGKWDTTQIEVKDEGLQGYITTRPIYLPHSDGRHEHQRFWKSKLSIVERLVNRLMSPGMVKRGKGVRTAGSSTGKKLKIQKIVEQSFDLINLKTQKNPVQVLVDAVINSAPTEEDIRVTYGGTSYRKAADIAPQRRIDLALRYLAEAVWRSTFSNVHSAESILATELIAASNKSPNSAAVRRKEERERIARSAR
ncbi:MAG: 30S ribosomal protein S7 [Candidatus Ranarchaeia archaeon]|jgi:small subunit ribosomal protein S7